MDMIKIIFYTSIALISTFLAARESDDRIAKLQSSYEQSLAFVAEPLAELNRRYTEELEKLKKQYQVAGDLKSALLVDSELEEYSEDVERDFRTAAGLKRLRTIYDVNQTRLVQSLRDRQMDIHRKSIQKFGQLSLEFTKAGDLPAAVKCKEIKESIEKSLSEKKLEGLDGNSLVSGVKQHNEKVSSEHNADNPMKTGVTLLSGQKFKVLPNPEDKWSGGGSKQGVFCDYKGYPDRRNNWMRMFLQIADEKAVPVDPDLIQSAPVDGILKLYAEDGSAAGNVGEIRVEIVVDPESSP